MNDWATFTRPTTCPSAYRFRRCLRYRRYRRYSGGVRRLDGEYYSVQVILFCEDIEFENCSYVSERSRSFPSSDICGTRLCRATAKPPSTFRDRDPLGAFRVPRILLFQRCELGVRSRGFSLRRISRERRFCL